MRGNILSGPAAVLLLAFFFLPWFSVSVNGRMMGQFSGYQLAVGVGGYALEGLNGRYGLFLVLAAAVVILFWSMVAAFWPSWHITAAVGIVLAALLGLGVMALLLLPLRGPGPGAQLEFVPEPGFWLTGIALLGATAGAGLLITAAARKSVIGPVETGAAQAADTPKQTPETAVSSPHPPQQTPPDPHPAVSPVKSTAQSLYKTGAEPNDPSIKVWLVVSGGDYNGSRFRLTPPTRIGRDASNDIVIEDKAMSGYHAVVREQGGAFHIQDLNSTNGIYLENQTRHRWQQVPAATLVNDMRLKLGHTVFQVVVEE